MGVSRSNAKKRLGMYGDELCAMVRSHILIIDIFLQSKFDNFMVLLGTRS